MDNGFTIIDAGGDIQKSDFICALFIVSARHFNRIPGIADINKLDALYDTARIHIEAGNDAFCQTHLRGSSRTQLISKFLSFGEIQATFINGLAGDGAFDTFICDGAKIPDVIQVSDPARCDDRNRQFPGKSHR